MTGSITNIEQLEKWFRAGNLPFFSLKYAGTGDKTIFRNEVWEDMEDAWEQLRNQVEAQASAGRAMLEILVYKKGSANHPLRTNVDIRPGYYPAQAGISGPGMYPQMGIGNVQEYVTKEVRIAMLERDNEARARRGVGADVRQGRDAFDWLELTGKELGENVGSARVHRQLDVVGGVVVSHRDMRCSRHGGR